jgi:hypothetical protein
MNKLAITKEQFEAFYPMMKTYSYIFYEEFKTDKQFVEEY